MLLARMDVNVNSKDALGKAPLHRAAQVGFEDIVRLLLERPDIDVNAKNNYGMTALSLAVEKGYERVVKLILEKENVDLMIKDKWGKTPVSWATEKEHRGLMKLLLPRIQHQHRDRVIADEGLKVTEVLDARPEENERHSDVRVSPGTSKRRTAYTMVNAGGQTALEAKALETRQTEIDWRGWREWVVVSGLQLDWINSGI